MDLHPQQLSCVKGQGMQNGIVLGWWLSAALGCWLSPLCPVCPCIHHQGRGTAGLLSSGSAGVWQGSGCAEPSSVCTVLPTALLPLGRGSHCHGSSHPCFKELLKTSALQPGECQMNNSASSEKCLALTELLPWAQSALHITGKYWRISTLQSVIFSRGSKKVISN